MATFAILPIKRFDRAKQRLRKGLAQATVSELVQTMFEDVLSSLERTRELEQILVVTSEYRFGTIRPTFVFTPRRWVVLTAKYVASMLAGIAFAMVGQGLPLVWLISLFAGAAGGRSRGAWW